MGTIDDYEIERPLWRSDYYTVSLAKDKRTERTVEIWWCDTPVSPERFHAVLPRLLLFRNHRIADVLDGDVTDGGAAWVACEHFDGAPLPDVMEAGPFDAVLAIEMVLQIGAGLKEAHADGLIHGDIHPRHVVSADDDEVKLCGLGIVQLFGLPQGKATAAPAYRAPEVLGGDGSCAATDIYSIGLILYELIAGKPAFADNCLLMLNDPPAALACEPKFVWPVVERAMAKHPAERYRSMAEFLRLLHDTHWRCWEFIQQMSKLLENEHLANRARQHIHQQQRTARKSGYDWNQKLKALERAPEMPPVPSDARRSRHNRGGTEAEAPSRTPQAHSIRRWSMRRAVELGVLMALLWIAGQNTRPFSEPHRLNHALTLPSIRLIPTAPPPVPSVPTPPPFEPAPTHAMRAWAPVAVQAPQSPPAGMDACQLAFYDCQ